MNDTQTIKSSAQLASMMATKAVLMREVFANILKAPVEEKEEGGLHDQYAAFKELLIHDIKPEDFADIYAETIAYAMFAARLHDSTLDNFSRQAVEPVTRAIVRFGFMRAESTRLSLPEASVGALAYPRTHGMVGR